jgi:integrase
VIYRIPRPVAIWWRHGDHHTLLRRHAAASLEHNRGDTETDQEIHRRAADPRPGLHRLRQRLAGLRLPRDAEGYAQLDRRISPPWRRPQRRQKEDHARVGFGVTPDQAREAAGDVLARVRFGEDAPYDRAARRASPMLADLITEFMNEEIRPTRKPRTADLYAMYFRVHVRPVLGSKRAREVTSAEVGTLHRKIGTKTPVTANRVVALLSSLFSWAAGVGKVPKDLNPARGITRYREQGRERFLSGEELARLGDALREAETVGVPWVVDESSPKAKHVRKDNRRSRVSPYATAALRLLLLTGCRLREILNLRWEEFDRERGMLLLPDSKTGRKPVVLSGAAIAVLESIPRAGDYVIAGLRPENARHDLKRPWEAIRHRAGLGPIRLHDLRHTFAATGAGSNLGLPVIGKLLGHKRAETTSRYAHIAADPLKTAADAIAAKLAAKMGEPAVAAKDGAKVIGADFKWGRT